MYYILCLKRIIQISYAIHIQYFILFQYGTKVKAKIELWCHSTYIYVCSPFIVCNPWQDNETCWWCMIDSFKLFVSSFYHFLCENHGNKIKKKKDNAKLAENSESRNAAEIVGGWRTASASSSFLESTFDVATTCAVRSKSSVCSV